MTIFVSICNFNCYFNYDFIPIYPDYHLKSLTALCRMVTNTTDYSESYKDTDLDSHNIKLTKKKRIEHLPDVLYANRMAEQLESLTGMNLQVCHRLEGDIYHNDFLSSIEGWMHPGKYADYTKFITY